jgi:hypothetical protein
MDYNTDAGKEKQPLEKLRDKILEKYNVFDRTKYESSSTAMDEYAKEVATKYAEYIIGKLSIEGGNKLTDNDKFCIMFPSWNSTFFDKFVSDEEQSADDLKNINIG